jgi:hypothetical protein
MPRLQKSTIAKEKGLLMQLSNDSPRTFQPTQRTPGQSRREVTARPRQWVGALSACLYAGYVLSVSALLLFCNSLTSFVIYSAIPQSKDQVVMAALTQMFFFLMPVLLTFFQWYLFDHLKRLVSR